MTPRDREALGRIVECIDIIAEYVARVGAAWPTDGMAIDAIAKRVEEIGEVIKRVTPATLAMMPGVNWRAIKGIRDVIAHDYDDVDSEVLAMTVRNNLPGLRAAVSQALAGS